MLYLTCRSIRMAAMRRCIYKWWCPSEFFFIWHHTQDDQKRVDRKRILHSINIYFFVLTIWMNSVIFVFLNQIKLNYLIITTFFVPLIDSTRLIWWLYHRTLCLNYKKNKIVNNWEFEYYPFNLILGGLTCMLLSFSFTY